MLDRGAIAFDEFQENENNRSFLARSERWEICDDLPVRMATNNYYSASQETINLSVDTMGFWKDSIRFDKFDWTDDRANKLRCTHSPVQASVDVSRTGTRTTYSKTLCQLA